MSFVIKKKIVADCFKRLRSQKTHEHFAGYLCLQRQSARLSRLANLEPDFAAFFDEMFSVGKPPAGTPYIKPFISQKPGKDNLWLNKNVAGSYAPSSIRNTLRKVVEVDSAGRYTLKAQHAQLAFEHLLHSRQLPVAELAVFLYRDFGLVDDATTIRDLIDIFAYEFGYASGPGGVTNNDFAILYSKNMIPVDNDWLESI